MRGFLKARLKAWLRFWLLLALLLPLSPPVAAAPLQAETLPAWYAATPPPAPLSPDLMRALAAGDDAPLRVLVFLREAPSVQALPTERGTLVATMQAHFAREAAPLEGMLASAEAEGDLLARRDLWIVHALALTVRPALIERLRRSPAVAEIRLDVLRRYLPEDEAPVEVEGAEEAPWGLTAVEAPRVWATLRISGTGAVVAGMDTGVDWHHPELHDRYFGLHGGLADHTHAWFDAVNGGTYPYDDHGHGTHTLGTAVGETVGVAPGARWMAVKVLSGDGYGYDSWILAGFQWLLAPGGEPALAPDVVNCSWGSTQSTATTFQEAIAALERAGTFVAFAAGNSGPSEGSLGSPASLPGVFAVGALDPYDSVPYFSSRGPSPWGEVKPYVVAPGVNVRSALPGGTYGSGSGTSMATPHVSGIVALMRAVSPTVPVATMAAILTETARPLSTTLPNNESGWGAVDAYAALCRVAQPAFLTGTVSDLAGEPLPTARIVAEPRDGLRPPVGFGVDAAGRYEAALASDRYTVTASAFGYQPQSVGGLLLLTGTTTRLDFHLTPRPTGTLAGRITVLPDGLPPTLPLSLRVEGTPVATSPDATGRYTLPLPAGRYTVAVRGNGYRLATATVAITAGETTGQDFLLRPAPTLLLVDEGAWYYESALPFWTASLDALGYVYATWVISHPPVGETFSRTLPAYDVVLWSSPFGSPGMVGAGEALRHYLLQGGRLLLSGQDIAAWDGPLYLGYAPQHYFREELDVVPVADATASRRLTGALPFAGEVITIEGGSGADNQQTPDVVQAGEHAISERLWRYGDGGVGGVAAYLCVPYRALYFAFGYEAIADRAARDRVMAEALEWLTAPLPEDGLRVEQAPAPQIGLPGNRLTFTVVLRHLGLAGEREPLTLTVAGGPWAASVEPGRAWLSPCERLTATVVVTIPPDAPINARAVHTLTVASPLRDVPLTLALRSKTPAPLLVVDGHRWHAEAGAHYTATLEAAAIPYDWVPLGNGGLPPADEVLDRYPLLFWFTAYDWYRPVGEEAEAALMRYLAQGGHLLLTSQDFLGTDPRPLAVRMGVASQEPDVRSAWAESAPEFPPGGWWSGALEPLFPNWSDRVEPAPTATVAARDAAGMPMAVATADGTTYFAAFSPAMLAPQPRAEWLRGALGYLSPLGASRFEVTPTTLLPGERLTFTAVLRYRTADPIRATLRQSLPAPTYTLASLAAGMVEEGEAVAWTGTVGTALTFTWSVTVSAAEGSRLDPVATFGLPDWGLDFPRHARVRVGGGDLGASGWLSSADKVLRWGQPTTLTFRLRNVGTATATVQVRFHLVPSLTPPTATEPTTVGTTLLGWEGELAAGAVRDLSVGVVATQLAPSLRLDALVEEDGGLRRYAWPLPLRVQGLRLFLPIIFR